MIAKALSRCLSKEVRRDVDTKQTTAGTPKIQPRKYLPITVSFKRNLVEEDRTRTPHPMQAAIYFVRRNESLTPASRHSLTSDASHVVSHHKVIVDLPVPTTWAPPAHSRRWSGSAPRPSARDARYRGIKVTSQYSGVVLATSSQRRTSCPVCRSVKRFTSAPNVAPPTAPPMVVTVLPRPRPN